MVATEVRPVVYFSQEPEITPREAFINKYGAAAAEAVEEYCIPPSKNGYVETPKGLAYRTDIRDRFANVIVGKMSELNWLDQGPFLTEYLKDVASFKPQIRHVGEIGEKWGNYIAGRIASHKWQDQGPYLAGVFRSQEIKNK
ncbi:MAG TPA: hypothetical protein VG917_02795 [Patescibacteria group bacterium]|nr:hypothetical protein [Patescibacteria group bacterium]